MAFYPLEKLLNLYDGYRQAFSVAGQSLLLVQENNRRVLIHNRCPHQNAPLTQATIVGEKIRCPHHGIQFDLISGQSDTSACPNGLEFLPLAYDGNTVGVDL